MLLKWLPLVTGNQRNGIVRALGQPWARATTLDPLIAEFQHGPVPGDVGQQTYRWEVADAVRITYLDTRFDQVAALAQDRRYGYTRDPLLVALGGSKRPEAVDVLLSQLDCDDVSTQVIEALGRLGDERARPVLEGVASGDGPGWKRQAAKRALAKMTAKQTRAEAKAKASPSPLPAPKPPRRRRWRGSRQA